MRGSKSIVPNIVLDVIHPGIPTRPAAMRTDGITGHSLDLLDGSIISVRLQREGVGICLSGLRWQSPRLTIECPSCFGSLHITSDDIMCYLRPISNPKIDHSVAVTKAG